MIDSRNQVVRKKEEIGEDDIIEMLVDLRSKEEEKRKLKFFIRGKQMKNYFKGLPSSVVFAVLLFFFFPHKYFLYLFLSFFSSLISSFLFFILSSFILYSILLYFYSFLYLIKKLK